MKQRAIWGTKYPFKVLSLFHSIFVIGDQYITQCPWAVRGWEKNWWIWDSNTKLLHCLKVNLISVKFFSTTHSSRTLCSQKYTTIFTASLQSLALLYGFVIRQWLSQPMIVQKIFNDTEEYSLRSIAIVGCNRYSLIAVAHVTLPKAAVHWLQSKYLQCMTLMTNMSHSGFYQNRY